MYDNILLYGQLDESLLQMSPLPAIQALPDAEWKAAVLKYRRDQQRWTSLLGKYLLLHGLRLMGYSESGRQPKLAYGPYGRPRIKGGPDFNLTHSDTWVACALVPEGRIGIDLQADTQRDKSRLVQVFAPDEIRLIEAGEHSAAYFWSRKEALSKAIGLGMRLPYHRQEVIDSRVEHGGVRYYLQGLTAPRGFQGHLAGTRLLRLSYVQYLALEPVADQVLPRLRLRRFCLQQPAFGSAPSRSLGLALAGADKIPGGTSPVSNTFIHHS